MIFSTIPVSAIIPTKDRLDVLIRTINSVCEQSVRPAELIIIDASVGDPQIEIIKNKTRESAINLIYQKATKTGAACQRMQGLNLSSNPMIWFLDDDIILEESCTERLWNGFAFRDNVGAVNAMIMNQRYTKPGRITLWMYKLMNGSSLQSYAGRIIGPAWNLLPEDNPDLPSYVSCEWLNSTCTMFRRDAMPDPLFSDFFVGYSYMEDVALSFRVSQSHLLLNARTARIFHDSQGGAHKSSYRQLSKMELVNRHYVMVHVLHRNAISYYGKLILLQFFGLVSQLRTMAGWKYFFPALIGKIQAVFVIIFKRAK